MKQEMIYELNRKIANSTDKESVMFFDSVKDELIRFNKAIVAMQALIDQSEGIAGLDLNGDITPWEDLLEGGNRDEWLLDFSYATEHTLCPI